MRLLRVLRPLILAGIVCLAGSPAAAGSPNPPNSTVDPCLHVCPSGDMIFHVVVRDALSFPVAGSSVMIDFRGCVGVTFCPTLPTDPYTFVPPASLLMVTNAAGIADFPIRAGGVCRGTDAVLMYADGVFLRQRDSVASPDQNGDLTVDAVDGGILAAKLGGPYDPTADLNCNQILDIGDLDALNAHIGHGCPAVVPVVPKTWGAIKMIYR